jgi:hypothetical protein
MNARVLTLLVLAACGNAPAPQPTVATIAPPASASAAPSSSACAEDDYVPEPAWSGERVALPAAPMLPSAPEKDGDAFTVFGAVHRLNARFRDPALDADIVVIGYIIDTNLPRAPKCAIHSPGKANPSGCDPETPEFRIADAKDATAPYVRVLGWASSFAQVYGAMLQYKSAGAQPYQDVLWNIPVPNPLPAVGAKVKVTGRYRTRFFLGGASTYDPLHGILSAKTIEQLERAPAPATLGK